jgi:photosynthetic reaction center H subunit
MPEQAYNGGLDVTLWVLYAFWLLFAGLVLYLRREDRREGYPLEDDMSGRREPLGGLFFTAQPKVFHLPGDGGKIVKPDFARDERPLRAHRTAPWAGSPLEPDGDPLTAGVGPGSYAQRANRPDITMHGDARIAPLRVATGFSLDKADPNLIGMQAVGGDNVSAGKIVDVWIDRAEYLVRYLEIEVEGGKRVLAPMTMAQVQRGRKRVKIDALLGAQFAGAPALANPDQITRDEEERVCAYFGAGYLYAAPGRSEPWL